MVHSRVQLSSEGPRPLPPKDGYVQIHVSFISKQLKMLVTEVVLRKIFSPFGAIADVAVKRHTVVQRQHRQSGYGFVYFLDPDDAFEAMTALKQNTIFDITLDCSISHKSVTRPTKLPPSMMPMGNPGQGMVPLGMSAIGGMNNVNTAVGMNRRDIHPANQGQYGAPVPSWNQPPVPMNAPNKSNTTALLERAAYAASRSNSGNNLNVGALPPAPPANTSASISTTRYFPQGQPPRAREVTNIGAYEQMHNQERFGQWLQVGAISDLDVAIGNLSLTSRSSDLGSSLNSAPSTARSNHNQTWPSDNDFQGGASYRVIAPDLTPRDNRDFSDGVYPLNSSNIELSMGSHKFATGMQSSNGMGPNSSQIANFSYESAGNAERLW